MPSSHQLTAFVTGGGKNIGRWICKDLAAKGFDVVINGRSDQAACEGVAEEVRQAGRRALVLMGDIGDRKATNAMAKQALAEFGTITAFVANAAIRPHRKFLELDEAHWREVVSVDLESSMFLSQAFIPGMLEQKWGRIVLLTGRHAMRGDGGPQGRSAVSISKHGLWGLAKSLAHEFGRNGITANAVSPGMIDDDEKPEKNTPHGIEVAKTISAGRFGHSQELSATCAFLCSDEGAYINGQMIGVNGAWDT